MLFAAALAMMLSPVQAAAPPPRPCAAPLHRQFDFWIGAWDVVGPVKVAVFERTSFLRTLAGGWIGPGAVMKR